MMGKRRQITDVDVSTSYGSMRFAVGCTYAGFRYHYWSSDTVALLPESDVLLKNPPRGTVYSDPGYFRTRRLSVAKNQWMIDQMREYALAHDLPAAAMRVAEAGEARRIVEAQAAHTVEVLQHVRWLARIDDLPIDGMSDADLLAALKRLFADARKVLA